MNKKIAVFYTEENSKSLKILQQSIDKSIDISGFTYSDLEFFVTSKEIEVSAKGESLDGFDLVYFRSLLGNIEIINTVIAALPKLNYISNIKPCQSLNKLYQYASFARAGIKIPDTLCSIKTAISDEFIDNLIDRLGSKIVVKPITGKHGEDCHLLSSREDIVNIIENKLQKGQILCWQRFVSNSCDYRVIVINEEAKLVVKRQRHKDTDEWRNNISLGADRIIIPISEVDKSILDIAIKGANALGYSICGADVMINDETNEPLLLEINSAPDLNPGTDRATADYLFEKAQNDFT